MAKRTTTRKVGRNNPVLYSLFQQVLGRTRRVSSLMLGERTAGVVWAEQLASLQDAYVLKPTGRVFSGKGVR